MAYCRVEPVHCPIGKLGAVVFHHEHVAVAVDAGLRQPIDAHISIPRGNISGFFQIGARQHHPVIRQIVSPHDPDRNAREVGSVAPELGDAWFDRNYRRHRTRPSQSGLLPPNPGLANA